MEIATETAAKWSIPNRQQTDLSGNEDLIADLFKARHGVVMRTRPNPTYNCHGLTFASRRTCIDDKQSIARILKDDSYREVQLAEVLAGDVVIYFDQSDGHACHSGIVVELSITLPRRALVVSKWGMNGEFLHWADRSEYGTNYKFYRVDREGERQVIQSIVLT